MSDSLQKLRIKIFADGADLKGMRQLYENPLIKGLTTNPTLMNKVGIRDYEVFARETLEFVRDKPISFEVFSDDFPEMRRQALKISRWQENVYVKVPITNTRGETCLPLAKELINEGVKLNITAILTPLQLELFWGVFSSKVPLVLSVFAGRIADTGRDPLPLMRQCLDLMKHLPHAELLWASVREILNIRQAEQSGAHIITVPHDILKKALQIWDKDLIDLSLDTVKMFERDAREAAYRL